MVDSRRIVRWGALLTGCAVLGACTQTSRLALLSDGNLDGKMLSSATPGATLQGEDCGMAYYLANAFRNAIGSSGYDTLVDVEVTSTAGITPFGQCLKVKGRGVRSADLPPSEESR